MQMELVLVFAYATGRTLVLPPDQPMYLLNAGQGHEKAHSFADFFPFDLINERFPVISMEVCLIDDDASIHWIAIRCVHCFTDIHAARSCKRPHDPP